MIEISLILPFAVVRNSYLGDIVFTFLSFLVFFIDSIRMSLYNRLILLVHWRNRHFYLAFTFIYTSALYVYYVWHQTISSGEASILYIWGLGRTPSLTSNVHFYLDVVVTIMTPLTVLKLIIPFDSVQNNFKQHTSNLNMNLW